MKFKFSLIKAKFIERPNRFITIIEINGFQHKSHLADPGRLKELLIPGVDLLVRKFKKSKNRKTKFSTIMVNHNGQLISLVSTLPNNFVKRKLVRKKIPFLKNYKLVRPEIPLGKHRFDFLLKDEHGEDFILEVKSVTLVKNKIAMFPDAVTLRGKNHVKLLTQLAIENKKAGILFVCQRPDAVSFQPMWNRDPKFCHALQNAYNLGVKIWCITLNITENEITYHNQIPTQLNKHNFND
jgi:sugar fermentation stimulation protein A